MGINIDSSKSNYPEHKISSLSSAQNKKEIEQNTEVNNVPEKNQELLNKSTNTQERNIYPDTLSALEAVSEEKILLTKIN